METIFGKFMTVHEKDLKTTTQYLSSIGMTFCGELEDIIFFIQTKEKPEILSQLKEHNYLVIPKEPYWTILKMTPNGILLYIPSPVGDGYVFVPSNNIISIHTVDKNFLVKIRKYVDEYELIPVE